MRLIIAAIVWVMASVVVAGALVTVALAAPSLGLGEGHAIGWVSGAGFLIAVPVSYWLGGKVLSAVQPQRQVQPQV